jgi:hypothetical protein
LLRLDHSPLKQPPLRHLVSADVLMVVGSAGHLAALSEEVEDKLFHLLRLRRLGLKLSELVAMFNPFVPKTRIVTRCSANEVVEIHVNGHRIPQIS